MLTPEYLNSLPVEILELYTLLDESIARAIARRLVRMGFASDSTAWQVNKLQEAGLLYEDVIALVAKYLPASEKAIKSVFSSAAIKSLEFDNAIFEAAGLTPIAFRQSPAMTQQLIAGLNRTNGTLKNLTLTTANTAQTAYIQACDLAHMQVSSGAMDYITAIKEAVMSASSEGAKVLYPSGHTDQLDVAVRRATLTGVSQTTGELSLMNAQEMGCDLMEITAHSDARPDHAAWQGKIVSLSGAEGYLSLDDIGYGTGAGFKGWNCRHDWYPFFEGISHRMYSDEKLKEWKNNPIPYEDSQRQRAMERDIRKTKRELAGLDEAIKNAPNDEAKTALEDEFRRESIRLKSQEANMKAFCKEKDLLVQNERVQVQGFGRSQAQKAVHANKSVLKKQSESANIKLQKVQSFKQDLSQGNINLSLRTQKQFEHTYTKQWRARVSKDLAAGRNLPGVFNRDVSLESLVSMAGTGTIDFRSVKSEFPIEYITAPNPVGRYFEKKANSYVSTSRFAIIYSKKGVHMYPVQEEVSRQ